jgi:hypothetical protein
MKTFYIEYTLKYPDNSIITKKCKIRNCFNEFNAKAKLGEIVNKSIKEPVFIEITKINEDLFSNLFGGVEDIFKGFSDIFKH